MFNSILIRGGGLLINLLFSIYISREFSIQEVGDYFYLMSLVILVSCFSTYGLEHVIIRDTAKSIKVDFHWLALVILVVLVIISCVIISKLFNYDHYLALSLSVVFYSVIKLYISFEKGSFRLTSSILFESILPSVLLFFVINIYPFELTAALPVSLLLVTSFLIIKLIYNKEAFPFITSSRQHNEFLYLIKGNYSFFVIVIFNVVMGQLDTIMLGFLDTASQVANYNLSIRFANVASVFLVFVNSYVAPRFSKYYSINDFSRLDNLFKKSFIFCLILSCCFFVFIFAISDYIASIYPNKYDIATLLIILTIGTSLSLGFGPIATYLTMTQQEVKHRNTVVIALVFNCICNYILIPRYGAVGAAVSTIVSILLKNVFGLYYLLKSRFR